MIVLNIRQMCQLRGIAHPHSALVKAGISRTVASDYLRQTKTTFVLAHIEILVKLLRCTPNDLFKWQPSTAADDYPESPLQPLRQQPDIDLTQLIATLSAEQIRDKFKVE